jgi:hypothetical protein
MELMVEASVKLPHLNTSGRKPVRVGFLSVPTSLPSDRDGSGSVGWRPMKKKNEKGTEHAQKSGEPGDGPAPKPQDKQRTPIG